jgi:hypothetical protein
MAADRFFTQVEKRMQPKLEHPDIEALAEALGLTPILLKRQIYDLGLGVLAFEAQRIASEPSGVPGWLKPSGQDLRLVHWHAAAQHLLEPNNDDDTVDL